MPQPRRITEHETAPNRAEMDMLLRGYYGGEIAKLVALGGPDMSPDAPIADFWAHVADCLPPRGCLCTAHDESGPAGL